MEIELQEYHNLGPGMYGRVPYPAGMPHLQIPYIGSGNFGDITDAEIILKDGLPYFLQLGFYQSSTEVIFNSHVFNQRINGFSIDPSDMETKIHVKVHKIDHRWYLEFEDRIFKTEVENPSQIRYENDILARDFYRLHRILLQISEQPIRIKLSDQIELTGFVL